MYVTYIKPLTHSPCWSKIFNMRLSYYSCLICYFAEDTIIKINPSNLLSHGSNPPDTRFVRTEIVGGRKNGKKTQAAQLPLWLLLPGILFLSVSHQALHTWLNNNNNDVFGLQRTHWKWQIKLPLVDRLCWWFFCCRHVRIALSLFYIVDLFLYPLSLSFAFAVDFMSHIALPSLLHR